MQVKLTEEEVAIIVRYKKHIWDIAMISMPFRDVLKRILLETDEGLHTVERDLKYEENNERG